MHLRPIHMFLALGLVACAANEDIVRVDSVELVGNKALSRGPIVDGLATHPPTGFIWKDYAEYDEVSVAKDRERIESYYHQNGYFDARVTNVAVKHIGADEVSVAFSIAEGEPTHIKTVDIQAMPP